MDGQQMDWRAIEVWWRKDMWNRGKVKMERPNAVSDLPAIPKGMLQQIRNVLGPSIRVTRP